MTTNRLGLRRKVCLGTTLLALGAFLGMGAASCVTLPAIQGNQCGNLVVEPENGEACDQDTPSCGKPSSIGACRFICDYQDPEGIQCPTGLGCGLDGICRMSDGLSESPISIAGGGTQRLLSGDFDGDGRSDVVAVGFSTVDIHFLTTEGYVDYTATLPNEVGLPGVGDVDGDGLTDIVLSLDHSVGVLLGQEERSFAPESHTTMFIRPNTRKLVSLGAYTDDGVILSLAQQGPGTDLDLITLNDRGGHHLRPADPPSIDGYVTGAIATRGVKAGGKSCAVVAFEIGAGTMEPARLAIGVHCDKLTIDTVPFPGNYPWGGAYFADVDNNGDPDLFYGVSDSEGDNAILRVIRTDANGNPQPPEDFLYYEKGNCYDFSPPPQLASAPLAVGDLNGDGYTDIVDNRGVLLFNPNASQAFTRLCHTYSFVDPMDPAKTPVAWTNAVIGDFNGDGRNDVLASRRGEGVLDLWMWQPGGFNTIPIYVGGPVAELVSGDLDGDTIADAAFRFEPPMGGMGAAPLLAMFGNPLALPSEPQPLGFLGRMEHIVAGRIKGTSWTQGSDVLADLVVISEGDMPNGPMPLTLFQGNPTRNLVAPLSLQHDTTDPMPLAATDKVHGIFVSDFASSACRQTGMGNMTDDVAPRSNIVALGDSGRIWLAGCLPNGSSVPVQENLDLDNVSFLFAPVDSNTPNDALAVFMSNPPFDAGMNRTLGLGVIEHLGGEGADAKFSTLPNPMPPIDPGTILPSAMNLDAPFAVVDVDGNGLRDVVVTGQTGDLRKIFIYWNEDAKNTMSTNAVTTFTFTSQDVNFEIKDITALNIDDDPYRELAILTKDHVYLAKVLKTDDYGTVDLMLGETHPLDASRFADIRNGEALLAIDADSDGIDDLIVADTGKLLLFIGTERLK